MLGGVAPEGHPGRRDGLAPKQWLNETLQQSGGFLFFAIALVKFPSGGPGS
jgi:hypothetical protein